MSKNNYPIGQSSENWKWGIFYYNKQDPRLLPPKRNPMMGWTVNFANWKSVTLMVMIILASLLIGYICKR